MKNFIAISTLVIAIFAVVATGLWYANEQETALRFSQTSNITERVDSREVHAARQIDLGNKQQTDPFGLSGSPETVYEIALDLQWSNQTHADSFPDGAYVNSPLVWSGRKDTVFILGEQATPGVEELVEEGRNRVIDEEMNRYLKDGTIHSFETYTRFNAPGNETYRVQVSRDIPYVSMIAGVAPTPDWAIAFLDQNMLEDGRWIDQKELSLALYDIGTKEGQEFANNGETTLPQETIAVRDDAWAKKPLARVVITRITEENERN